MESEMKCNVSKMWSPRKSEGLDLEITHHPLTMRSVVNLIVAMERFKGTSSESVLSTEFRDEHLLNIMMENIVEEQVVVERGALPPAQINHLSEELCSMTDTAKRSLVLVQSSMELHSVILQGGAECRKVQLNMSTYFNPTPRAEADTVALGIKGKNYYLSCHKDGDKPTLHLETVENKDSLLSIGPDSDMVRFLFYRHESGLNISTFESVPFSGWYISTAGENNRPVEMCLESAERHRTFTIESPVECP